MNAIYLDPTDVLFFRDGRPMNGSLAGHTAAWPLPDVTNHALHAALWRSGFENKAHAHRRGCSGNYSDDRDRKFGSLLTAGPFPVRENGKGKAWFFPRPTDAQQASSVMVTHRPVSSLSGIEAPWRSSSLPAPLKYAIGNTQAPSKEAYGEPWISREAIESYIRGIAFSSSRHFLKDGQIADQEAQIGIAIDPETQTTGHGSATGKIYSAHYLRLREGFRLGLLAKAIDDDYAPNGDSDLIRGLFNGYPAQIVVGGQQRICTAHREDVPAEGWPLPCGFSRSSEFTRLSTGKFAVKWILLSPAIWPEIPGGQSKRGTKTNSHTGGWLPNWVCPGSGQVLLRTVSPEERRRRRSLHYNGEGYTSEHGGALEIAAKLVGALVPKPIVVTGWALPNGNYGIKGGAKSTHFAVPAGAVYYFEAESADHAEALAASLNWHGTEAHPTTIKNRRSTLMGEKGFGLGVCGSWDFYGTSADVPKHD